MQAIAERKNEVTENGITRKEDDLFVKMERLDETQIQEEIEGLTLLKDYFYEFGNVVGISWIGIKALRNLMSEMGRPISIQEAELQETETSFVYTVWAKLMTTGERSCGVSEQAKIMKTKNGDIPDVFARQKALSKAKRNAIKDFIPESFIKQVYSKWVDNKRQGFPAATELKSVGHSEALEKPTASISSEKNSGKQILSGLEGKLN